MIVEAFFVLFIMVLSRVVHEAGHYFRAKKLLAKPKVSIKLPFYLETAYDPNNKLSVRADNSVILAGVLLGVIPLLVLPAVGVHSFWVWWAFLWYFWACARDIKILVKRWYFWR